MKKRLMILMLLSIVSMVRAQETSVDPGQQAKGYLDSKNISVDHSTGIFYYSIPVHEIKMGNFTLPITLDYAARGVKTDDQPGTVGYNWNLNTGGVVTRQLRGGIADERGMGWANGWESVINENNDITPFVNLHHHDGEADVFTAVFNGRSVNFIIRYKDSNMEVIPLEPTDVKIKCILSLPDFISGWEITDEAGNKYVFQHQEIAIVTREGTVETNCVNQGYISSWYLLWIVPANAPMIEYEYYENITDNNYSRYDSIFFQSVSTRTTVDYTYGEPIVEHPYDFTKYKFDFDREIAAAARCFEWQHAEYYYSGIELNDLYRPINYCYLYSSPDEIYPEKIMQNRQTMGVLYNLRYVNYAYEGLYSFLDMMIAECNMQLSSSNARQAIIHLNNAKDIVKRCREEVTQVWNKDVYQFGCQKIMSPLLKKIKYVDKVIEFKYKRDRMYAESFLLDKIVVNNLDTDSIRSTRLTWYDRGRAVPSEISFHDKFGKKVSNIKFDYYDFVSDRIVTDIYGYYHGFTGQLPDNRYQNKQRFYYLPDENVFFNSLKTIHVSNDVEIELYYDFNRCSLSVNAGRYDSWDSRYHLYGGIRIGGIRITDKLNGNTDDILYYYIKKGTHVLPQLVNKLIISYPGGFDDRLVFDRLYNPGADAYVKFGNNGVYYSRVMEQFMDKGSVVYNFMVPDTTSPSYNYWEVGKPLGVCYYNSDGNLRKVIRYEYDGELALANKKYFKQVKPCEYFVDSGELSEKYKDNLYFADNMKKRLNPILPADQSYLMAYDYTVYLKRISEYYFEGKVSSTQNDYLHESSCYTRTEFDYDLEKSTLPVKKTVTGSDGTKYIEIVKRAMDFDDSADASIPLLKEKNMVGVPVKIQSKVVDHAGVERLLSEQVNVYERSGISLSWVLLTGVHEYLHEGTSAGNSTALFSFDRELYDKTSISYGHDMSFYLPTSTECQGDRVETRYDFITMKPIIKATLVPVNSVAACDYVPNRRQRPNFKLLTAASIKYKLLVLGSSTTTLEISLSVKNAGGTSTRSFTARANYLGPQFFELDLSAVAAIEEISLASTNDELLYLALVPVDCEFEATSYNADGTVYCKFDHNGQAERYEYDAAGRVIKTFDQDGNLLKENDYNVLSL